MRNRFFFCCIELVFFCAAWVYGDTDDVLTKSYLLFGVNEYYYHYSENLTPDGPHIGTPKSDEYGATSLFHVEGKWYTHAPTYTYTHTDTHTKSVLWYGKFLFEYGGGNQTYDGSTQDTEIRNNQIVELFNPVKNAKSNTFTKIEISGGPHFGTNDFMIAPHGGLMYYCWFRAGLGSTSETYTWLYLPLGIEMFYKASNAISFGCDIDYRLMLTGSMQVGFDFYNLVGVPASVSAVNLGIENGFLIDFPVRFQIDRYLGMECKTWFEWRPSGRSNTVGMTTGTETTPIYEPESSSYSIGFTISAMLRKI